MQCMTHSDNLLHWKYPQWMLLFQSDLKEVSFIYVNQCKVKVPTENLYKNVNNVCKEFRLEYLPQWNRKKYTSCVIKIKKLAIS
jgi:hypothetical protein